MVNYTFFRCSKIQGEAGKQKFYNKCSENSRSQIVFRTDIFRKLTLGAPDLKSFPLNLSILVSSETMVSRLKLRTFGYPSPYRCSLFES